MEACEPGQGLTAAAISSSLHVHGVSRRVSPGLPTTPGIL